MRLCNVAKIQRLTVGSLLGWLFLAFLGTETLRAIPEDSNLNGQDAATVWRFIGFKLPAMPTHCPQPSSSNLWQTRHLFRGIGGAPPTSAALSPFCLYTATGQVTATALTEFLDEMRPQLATLEPDYMVVYPAATDLGAVVRGRLEEQFDGQAGRATSLPLAPGTVQLVLLDTSPTGSTDPIEERSGHGATLRALAKRLLCEYNSCLAAVSTRLALPYTSFDQQTPLGRDDQRGGFIGTVSLLAEEVWETLKSWNESDPLVLNLSLGWDGSLIGGLQTVVEEMPLAARAVYQILDEATCAGALVIAAAGNRSGDRQIAPGALLPAAWETRRPSCGGTGYKPLIYAVGGVGRDHHPLVNALPESTPPLVAYGDHAVLVDGFGGGIPSANLTGSSVSTLIVASTAAALWAYDPELTASAVMDQLYATATPVPSSPQPDFCLSASPNPQKSLLLRPTVRRVSLCQTLLAADVVGLVCAPTGPLSIPEQDFVAVGLFDPGAVTYMPTNLLNEPACTTDIEYDLTLPATHPCPHKQYHDLAVQPWTHPQPRSIPCPSCTIRKKRPPGNAGTKVGEADCTADLYIEISPKYVGMIENPTLVACNRTFSLDTLNPFTMPGPSCPLRDDSPLPLRDADSVTISNFPCDCEDVMLAFTVDKDCDGVPEGVATSPVLVISDTEAMKVGRRKRERRSTTN